MSPIFTGGECTNTSPTTLELRSLPLRISASIPTRRSRPREENNLQYQSGGVYRQNQIIVSGRASYPQFSFFTFYTYNVAKADTNGVTYTPSVAQNPGLDYGRSSFDVHNRFVILGNFSAPYAISLTPFFAYNSGAPYNVTIGSDLTRNNQFNARPTFAASCSKPDVVSTQVWLSRYQPLRHQRKDHSLWSSAPVLRMSA